MLKKPLVFIFNILESQHAVFRTGLHSHLKQIFDQDSQECIFLPIRNSEYSTILKRAETIDQKLRNIGSAHVIALSVSGVDCRMALSKFDTPMQSLFTISSPHNGSQLATWAFSVEKKLSVLDPLSKFLGIPVEAFQELRIKNIQNLNKNLLVKKTQICSTSSWKDQKYVSDLFKETALYLQGDQKTIIKWNDGVFYLNEMKWGDHLLSFDGDHAEVMGCNLSLNCAPIYRLAIDNAKRHELHEENRIFR